MPGEVKTSVDNYELCLTLNDQTHQSQLQLDLGLRGSEVCRLGQPGHRRGQVGPAGFSDLEGVPEGVNRGTGQRAQKAGGGQGRDAAKLPHLYSAYVPDALVADLYSNGALVPQIQAGNSRFVSEEDSQPPGGQVAKEASPLANDFPTSVEDEADWGAKSVKFYPGLLASRVWRGHSWQLASARAESR